MAYGRIDIENIDRQADLAAEQLGTQHYAGHVSAAQGEASNIPGLGKELEDVWREVTELALAMQTSNYKVRAGMSDATNVLYGNPDFNIKGVIAHAEQLLAGSGALGTTIRREVTILGTKTTPVFEKYTEATNSTAELQEGLKSQNGVIQAVGALAAKLPQERFGRLVQTANRANDKLDDYVKEI